MSYKSHSCHVLNIQAGYLYLTDVRRLQALMEHLGMDVNAISVDKEAKSDEEIQPAD